MSAWQTVTVPVEAKCGPVEVFRWEQRHVFEPPDDGYCLPPAVGACCTLTFRFDRRWQRSKQLRAKVTLPRGVDPTEHDWQSAEREARRMVAEAVAAHGVTP